MTQLAHSRIVIGELLAFIAIENIDKPHHWVHKYADLYRGFVELGSRQCPNSCIAEHLVKAFGDRQESVPCN